MYTREKKALFINLIIRKYIIGMPVFVMPQGRKYEGKRLSSTWINTT